MADADLAMSFKLTPSLLEQLHNALIELQAHKDSTTDTVSFTEISDHFHDLETKLMNKYTELEAKEKAFKQEQSDTLTLLAAKETAVAQKEQDMFDRIQVLKDAAVAVIVETRTNHPLPAVYTDLDSKVICSLDETNPEPSRKTGDNEVTFLQELTEFCEQMDTNGLLTFIANNRENINVLVKELSYALECTPEPGRLILASVENFFNNNYNNINNNIHNNDKDMRESCISLMEAMNAMLARAHVGLNYFHNYETKQQAKAIADGWRLKLGDDVINDVTSGRPLEAEGFLHFIATFRIASEFNEDELCKLVVAVCDQKQVPELYRSLGLHHKMPGIIEDLISKEKIISAVHFVHAFDLVDKFPTVPLLKTYLKDLRRISQGKRINAPNSESVQAEGHAKELAALKSIINCVQKYNLESDYPLEPLHRRVGQLTCAKGDKKRNRESTGRRESTSRRESTGRPESAGRREPAGRRESTGKRPQNKKPRLNGGGVYGRPAAAAAYTGRQPPAAAAAPVYMDRGSYGGAPPPERYHHHHVDPYNNYQQPHAHAHASTSQNMYSQQVYEQSAYYYPQDDRRAAATAAAAAAAPPPAYGGYTSGVQSAYSSYQPYM